MTEKKLFMQENDKILDEWEKAFENNGGVKNNFSWDGIMFQGKIKREGGTDNNYWARKKSSNYAKENSSWSENPCRLLILAKDQNTAGGVSWDSRHTSFRNANSEVDDYVLAGDKFNKRLVSMIYGLAKILNREKVSFDFVDLNRSEILQFVDSYPFAFVNCKKEGGGASCSVDSLKDAIKDYDTFLDRQIKNIDADLFICCGSTQAGYVKDHANYSLDFLVKHGYDFQYAGSKYQDIYYDKTHNKIAIDVWHPSYRRVSDKEFYEQAVDTFCNFINDHKEFLKSHRL